MVKLRFAAALILLAFLVRLPMAVDQTADALTTAKDLHERLRRRDRYTNPEHLELAAECAKGADEIDGQVVSGA